MQLKDDSFPTTTTSHLIKGLFSMEELENKKEEAIRNIPRKKV